MPLASLRLAHAAAVVSSCQPTRDVGGKVPLRPGTPKAGERPFLVARVDLNHGVIFEAAANAAGCLKTGSGGPAHRTVGGKGEPR